MIDLLQTTLDGLAIGAAYGLIALGFTLVFGVMGRLNMAYGPSVMAGVFAGIWVAGQGWGWLATLAAVLAGSMVVTAYVERLSFAAIRGEAALASMVSSFALWMQIEELVARAFPARTYPFPPLGAWEMIEAGPFLLRPEYLLMLGTAIATVAALHLILTRTLFGLHLRTLSDNRRAAEVAGVPVARVIFLTFLLAALIGGLAGFLIAATDQQATPKFGLWATMKGLIAMVIGGLGSLRGALIGGLVLGVIEAQAQWHLGASGREIVTYGALFAALVLLPRGLTGLRTQRL